MNILHICANPKPTEESTSKQMAAQFFSALVERNPEFEVVNIDLYQDSPPYYSYETYKGMWYPATIEGYKATDDDIKATEYAREQGKLFNEADVLIITMPMWNFGVPAIVKAWLDQVIAPDITFALEKDGPRPLHHIRKVVLLVSSGGTYKENDERDSLTQQIRAALGFLGISDIDIAWADGQNPLFFDDSIERKQMAIEAAQEIAEDVADMP